MINRLFRYLIMLSIVMWICIIVNVLLVSHFPIESFQDPTPQMNILSTKDRTIVETIGNYTPDRYHFPSFQARKLRVFTYSKSIRTTFCNLASTAYYYGSKLYVVGWTGAITRTEPNEQLSKEMELKNRIDSLQDYLDKNTPREDDVILFLPAGSGLIQRDLADLLQVYQKLLGNERGIIFGGEAECGAPFPDNYARSGGSAEVFPYAERVKTYDYSLPIAQVDSFKVQGEVFCDSIASKSMLRNPGPYWGLNPSAFVGDIRSIRELLAKLRQAAAPLSTAFHQIFAASRDLNIVIDSRAELILNFPYFIGENDIQGFSTSTHRFTKQYKQPNGLPGLNTLTKTYPFVMIFPPDQMKYYASCAEQLLDTAAPRFTSRASKKEQKPYFFDLANRRRQSLQKVCSKVERPNNKNSF